MKNTLQIPKMLHEIHGEQSNLKDIILIHVIAISSMVLVLFLAWDGLSLLNRILLAILTYDLTGGVIANFSHSTSVYYAADAKKRRNFILLHVLQPTLLSVVFPDSIPVIVLSGLYIIGAASIVNGLKSFQYQIMLGAFTALLGIVILQIPVLNLSGELHFLLNTFMLKLPLAWAVRWYEVK